jgi:hypothetical protein
MYPINAASPERIAVGAVVQISDGAVQTSGVSISVRGQGGASGAGGGTTAYDNGIVEYTPTQAETNFTSFIVVAYKTGCIPACVTVVTTAAGTAGYAGLDWGTMIQKTAANSLTNTTVATVTTVTNQLTAAAIATGVWQDATAGDFTAANSIGKSVMNGVALGTGLTIAAVSGAVGSVTGAVGSVTGAVGSVTGAVGSVTGNVGGNVTGSVGSIAIGGIAASSFAADAIDATALAATAANEIRDAVWAKVEAELTGDPGATPTVLQALMLPYMAIRNLRATDSGGGTDTICNSAGATILTASITDAAGIFTKAKYA